MKIVLLFSRDANQRALAHRIASIAPVEAIIACTPGAPSHTTRAARLGRLARGIAGLPLRKAWFAMLDRYDRLFPTFPVEPTITVSDINDAVVADALESIGPQLVVVSGTNLLKRPLLEVIGRSAKVVNLHTGISPYVRGGPNCTNWCLAMGRFDLIGNSVMWIDEGIDSGNLVATEQTPLDRTESLTGLHIRVMDHAHDLLVRCVKRFAAGQPLPSVPQRDLGSGTLFLTRHWNAQAAARAVFNFYWRYRKPAVAAVAVPRLVSPEAG